MVPDRSGHTPKGGFAKLAPELHVNDLQKSLVFWRSSDRTSHLFSQIPAVTVVARDFYSRFPIWTALVFMIYFRDPQGLAEIELVLRQGIEFKADPSAGEPDMVGGRCLDRFGARKAIGPNRSRLALGGCVGVATTYGRQALEDEEPLETSYRTGRKSTVV